jgi:hypothetical protein
MTKASFENLAACKFKWVLCLAIFSSSLFVFSGCSSLPLPTQRKADWPPVAQGAARFVVYRDSSFSDWITFSSDVKLQVDGQDHGQLDWGTYIIVDVLPGNHELRFWKPTAQSWMVNKDDRHVFLAKAGETVYISRYIKRETDGFRNPIGNAYYKSVAKDDALAVIQNLKQKQSAIPNRGVDQR